MVNISERVIKMIKTAILTISDKASQQEREDKSGKLIMEIIKEIDGEKVYYKIIPDEKEQIKEELIAICDKRIADLILTTGGTGLAPRDVTPEATAEVIEKEVPGITDKMRIETAAITPQAYLSRARAGIRGKTLIVNLPGNPKAVKECLEAVFDILPHAIDILLENIKEHNKEG